MRIARILMSVGCGILAWYYLSIWYSFAERSSYLAFSVLALLAFVAAFWTHIQEFRRHVSPSRQLLLICAIIFLLPWAEWFHLTHTDFRETWSRQIFLQLVFVFGILLLFEFAPNIHEVTTSVAEHLLFVCGKRRLLFWFPVPLFFITCVWIHFFVFQGVPILPDPGAHLFQAKIFANLEFSAPVPPNQEFFSTFGDMLVMKDGRWFSMYQPGFPLLLSLFMLFGFERLLCPLLGALTIAIWMTYLHRYHGKQIATLFGWLALLSPFLLLMSSAVMVFTPELFLASCVLYLCRAQTEKESGKRNVLLIITLNLVMLVRSFSTLPFLLPILAYSAWNYWRRRSFASIWAMVAGIISGMLLLGAFQLYTTGNPFVSGYSLEYHDLRLGFETGKTYSHSPEKGLANVSNNLLGLNDWLSGWYSGSLLFVFLFFALEKKVGVWDQLLLAGCVLLAIFYFSFVFQDLLLGPRYFFPMSAFLLSLVARSAWGIGGSLNKTVFALIIAAIVTFLPFRLMYFLSLFDANTRYSGHLKRELDLLQGERLVVFLGKDVMNYFINWNEPFLEGPILFCRDMGKQNVDILKNFPRHRPVYYRYVPSSDLMGGTGGYHLTDEKDGDSEAPFRFVDLAMNLEAARHHRERDFFGICYRDLKITHRPREKLAYVYERIRRNDFDPSPRGRFRDALAHTAIIVLTPIAVFENNALEWQNDFSTDLFRREFENALVAFADSGDVGQLGRMQLEKIKRRMDRNRDGNLDDHEIRNYFTLEFSRAHIRREQTAE